LAMLALLNCSCSSNQSGANAPPTLLIGAWNTRFLGPSENGRFEERTPQDIATYISATRVSVLALQEVGQSPGLSLRNTTLDAVMTILNRMGSGDWDYVLFPSQDKQLTALLGIA